MVFIRLKKVDPTLYRWGCLCKKSLHFVTLPILLLMILSAMANGAGSYAMHKIPATHLTGGDKKAVINSFKAVREKQWKNAHDLILQVRDPLSVDAYRWLYYTKNAGPIEFRDIAKFIRKHPEWPKQGTLRLRAEKNMQDNLRDAEIVNWFSSYPPLTPDGMKRYMEAMAKLGANKHKRKVINEWWRETLLTPRQQKYFLDRYGKLIDRNSHKARFDYSLFNRHYTNARSIATVLGKGYRQLADARIALTGEKAGVDRFIERVPDQLRNDPGLLYERLRWRRRHGMNLRAMEILHNAPPVETISNLKAWWTERNIITRRLMENGQYKSAYLLADGHMQKSGLPFADAEFLAGWLALTHMDRPWEAFERFESLYHHTSTPISRARGSYWAGKASDALGYPDIARQWYRIAARHQTVFYGQTAVEILEEEHKPPHQVPPEITIKGHEKFDNRELVQVIKLFNRAGLHRETENFIGALTDNIVIPEEFRLTAELAQELGYRHSALATAKKAWKRNIFLVGQSYPTILSRLKKVDMEWALVHAVIRQESAFDYDAKSPAGARGLMQLMPATARDIARKSKISHRTSWLTSRPDHNIKLGSQYLGQLVKKFDDSYPLALAAYNAGPTRVSRWIKQIGDPRKGEIEMMDWIETIPIYETRNYVQRVMENVYVYRLMLRGVQKNSSLPIHVALHN